VTELDFTLEDQGSIFLLRPHTPRARGWLETNVQSDAQWFGDALVGEPRYWLPLAFAIQRDGMTVKVTP
jgi:hypothetical protein